MTFNMTSLDAEKLAPVARHEIGGFLVARILGLPTPDRLEAEPRTVPGAALSAVRRRAWAARPPTRTTADRELAAVLAGALCASVTFRPNGQLPSHPACDLAARELADARVLARFVPPGQRRAWRRAVSARVLEVITSYDRLVSVLVDDLLWKGDGALSGEDLESLAQRAGVPAASGSDAAAEVEAMLSGRLRDPQFFDVLKRSPFRGGRPVDRDDLAPAWAPLVGQEGWELAAGPRLGTWL